MGLVATLLALVPAGTANAVESVPALQYPAPTIPAPVNSPVESSDGSVTLPCSMGSGHGESDLITYGPSGNVVRQISRTTPVDGVPNCITSPIVDKHGDLYGIPWGQTAPGSSWVYGPNLLAYDGNTLKWTYPAQCGTSTEQTPMTIGADGNIYVLTSVNGNVRLLGLVPELKAGQTQPDVMVDIDVPNNCSVELIPYRDGIITKTQSSGLKYYNFGGKLVAEPYISGFSQGVANNDGVYFTPKWVGSSPTTTHITATHPAQGEVWNMQVSTPGANVQDRSLYPLAGGGVVALIREQKMYQGFPASPEEYIWTLTVLGSSGQLIQREYLPNQVGTTALGWAYLVPTSDGKMVVLRDITIPSGVSYPTTVPGIAIGVYDPTNDTWTYQESITGDVNAQGGPYGYVLDHGDYRHPSTVTDDTVTLIGRCSGNCPAPLRKLYALDVSGVATAYPKGETLTRTQRPGAAYIALGDSFSSGEGVEPFEAGTASTNTNTCHRSEEAYPQLIAGSSANIPALGTDSFRACSGAVTTNVTDLAQWNEGIQLDWWPDITTQVVTLTIGGNDIGFADFAAACVASTCQQGSSSYNTALNAINNELPSKLEATYERILAYAPNAEIYVIGYPHVVADKAPSDAFDSRCPYMHNATTPDNGAPGYPWEDAWAARDIVSKLNAKILAKVNEVDPTQARLHFISATESNSPFNTHEICGTSSTSYFQNVDEAVPNVPFVFHPNALGQQAYATLVEDYINAG